MAKDVTFKAITEITEEESHETTIDYVFDETDMDATYTVEYELIAGPGGPFMRPKTVTKNI